MRQILKNVYVNKEGEIITTSMDLHKKINGFVYAQTDGSLCWNIAHDLNTTGINVVVFSEESEIIFPQNVKIKNSFEVEITFSVEQAGTAFLIGNSLP